MPSSVDAVERALEAIAREDRALGAFVAVLGDAAREAARTAPAGPLRGVAFAVKDNIDVAGVATAAGTAILRDRVAQRDAAAVAALRAAGAVVVGKTNMHELAYGGTTQNPHWGPCRNPWDRERTPGGSSGGSAVAVAAGMVPLALGTDTGGSVRIPAALTGVTGLRPTLGAVSVEGVVPITRSFDTVGFIARTAQEIAPALTAAAGARTGAAVRDGLAGVRIGLLGGWFAEDVEPEVLRAVRGVADVAADAGADVREVVLAGAERLHERTAPLVRREAYECCAELLAAGAERIGPRVRRRLESGATVSPAEVEAARAAVAEWRREALDAFARVDVLLSPTTARTAPRIAEADAVDEARTITRLPLPASLAGLPALSMPCGFDAAGLPIGAQLAGRPGADLALLGVGAAFQRAAPEHLRTPPSIRMRA